MPQAERWEGPVLEVRLAIRPQGGGWIPGALEFSETIELKAFPRAGEGGSFDAAAELLGRFNDFLQSVKRDQMHAAHPERTR